MTKRTHPAQYVGGDHLDRRAERLIDREILANQSGLIDALIGPSWESSDPYVSCDDIENGQEAHCPECQSPDLKRHLGGENLEDAWSCEDCEWSGGEGSDHELDWQPVEVLEWWLVTPWLFDHLEAHGEAVLADPNGFCGWWGRRTSGQAILLDGVMQSICDATGYGENLEDPKEDPR